MRLPETEQQQKGSSITSSVPSSPTDAEHPLCRRHYVSNSSLPLTMNTFEQVWQEVKALEQEQADQFLNEWLKPIDEMIEKMNS